MMCDFLSLILHFLVRAEVKQKIIDYVICGKLGHFYND